MRDERPGPAAERAPGWHVDPDDPATMRHWDGRRWGAERRPRPSWAKAPPPAPGDGRPGRRRGPVLLGGAVVVALAVAAVGSLLRPGGPAIPPRSLTDARFTSQADAECADVLPALREDRPEPGPEGRATAAELAPRIERAADGLDGLVTRLDALAVAAADQAEVDRWLGDWRAYIAVGREYAATLRGGDASTGAAVGDKAERIGKRLFGFARANDMPACTP